VAEDYLGFVGAIIGGAISGMVTFSQLVKSESCVYTHLNLQNKNRNPFYLKTELANKLKL